MEAARVGAQSSHFCGELDLNRAGKRGFDWDLNDWSWDGERFVATPVAAVLPPPSNSSSSCSEEPEAELLHVVGNRNVKGDAEKRKRVVVIEEEDEPENGDGMLSLRIGVNAIGARVAAEHGGGTNGEERNGKKSRVQGGSSSGPACQVEGCGADLSGAKDYHRRHKVCEMHAKASTAVVGNAIQRFCQQCSRFHLLQEFDEGKRSCRRRLAGHNRRRRKTQPEASVGGALIDDKASSYLLLSLLRILSNMHSDNSERSKDQDLLSHLLRNLANIAGSLDARELSGLLQASQNPQKHGSSAGTSYETANVLVQNSTAAAELPGPSNSKVPFVNGGQCQQASLSVVPAHSKANIMATPEPMACKFKDFDLNDTCNDMEGCEDGYENSPMPASKATGSPNCPSWMQQDSTQSPPQTSGNSDSTSTHSLSSSNGDAQCRTDRIIFKLFDKDPNDLPLVLRSQILDWLSNSPTDIESYIRPGCIILTVYLRLVESAWGELRDDLSSHLDKLLNSSTDNFWGSGWVYAMVQHQIAFIYNGQIVLERPLPLSCPHYCKILCVRPIAAPYSATVKFRVEGFNLVSTSSRLICSFEGNDLFQENTHTIADNTQHEGPECLSFSCSVPSSRGRGFIEVEDHGFSNGFFPFIIAEPDVCSEICGLENTFESSRENYRHGRADDDTARNRALDFLNELGWLLRRANTISEDEKVEPPPLAAFNLIRFRYLAAFAMDQDWCAVTKILLDFLFIGLVDLGCQSPQEAVLSENLLHAAVRRNSVRMVKFLLEYKPNKNMKGTAVTFLFRPDVLGPSNFTPLHIAAASSDAEGVLDALTDDPGLVGINAWKNARDITGFTPEDYARLQGNDAYLNLVQKKIDRQLEKGHVVVGIPSNMCPIMADGVKPGNVSFEICKSRPMSAEAPQCNLCSRQAVVYPNSAARTFLYRPAMLTMMGIAVICICVGILLHTPPKVYYVFPSFRWELLGRGAM